MSDPFREKPLSLDQWLNTFLVDSREEARELQQAAVALQRSQVFGRVMNKIEAGVIRAIAGCSAADDATLMKFKLQLTGLSAIRTEIRVLAEDKAFEEKRSKNE